MRSIKIIDEDKYNHILYLIFLILIANSIPLLGMKSYGISFNYIFSAAIIFLASIVFIIVWYKHEKFIEIDSFGVRCYKNKLFKKGVVIKWKFKFEDFDKLTIKSSKTMNLPKNPSLDIIEFSFYRGNKIIEKEIIYSKLDYFKNKKINEILIDYGINNVIIIK